MRLNFFRLFPSNDKLILINPMLCDLITRQVYSLCVVGLWQTFSGLAKVASSTTNIDAENQTLVNHKCVCGALNRHFCQTRVTCCPIFCRQYLSHVRSLKPLSIAHLRQTASSISLSLCPVGYLYVCKIKFLSRSWVSNM